MSNNDLVAPKSVRRAHNSESRPLSAEHEETGARTRIQGSGASAASRRLEGILAEKSAEAPVSTRPTGARGGGVASANSRLRHACCRRRCCRPHRVPCTTSSTGTASRSTEAAIRSTSVRRISSACPAVRVRSTRRAAMRISSNSRERSRPAGHTVRLGGKSACWQPAKPGPAPARAPCLPMPGWRGLGAGAITRPAAWAKRAGAAGRVYCQAQVGGPGGERCRPIC